MALRLRRDVQKASYYVWFLGAEEARGLRGPRVINPVVPYLVERAREQEPLKVTLQVSHKGIKILQGSSKHFIPHSAITSSVQTEDIVACVLLLYNPATKCPLHVHAYRCDSETTAEALHQQLQVLINRPENQKRFAELESRLGITAPLQQPMNHVPEPKRVQRRAETSPKRFESSLGSDTGTSTRESECSEEHLPLSPLPKAKVNLFDSLAAELRAKLNGNGPPLLLPPRDYDTVHRSKGNLAAIELRRCRNSLIVGQTNQTTTTTSSSLLSQKQGVSSRGSSGIGSDLAPSPERQDGHSSSEDENWSNEAENSIIALQAPQTRRSSETRYRPTVEMSEKPKHPSPRDKYAYHRSLSREKEPPARHSWSREDEIRPIIMRPSDFDARFKKVMLERDPEDVAEFEAHRRASYMNGRDHYAASQDRKYRKHSDEKKPEKLEKTFQHKMILDKQQQQQQRYDYDDDFDSEEEEIPIRGENLTDRQKYQEAYIKKDKVVIEGSRHPNRHRPQMYYASPDRERSHHVDSYPPHYSDRNPYRESPQKNHKSPVIRYKSFDDSDYAVENEGSHRYNRSADKYAMNNSSPERYDHMERQYSSSSSRRQAKSSSPESSIKVSPKDRFYDAKEKFRALETNNKIPPYPEIHRRGSLDPADIIDTRYENWSDDEQRTSQHGQRKDRRHLDQVKRDHYHRNDPQYPPMVIHNSKSLSNIAKGYRHSYAEPRPPLPRGAPRVGLAAVNPF